MGIWKLVEWAEDRPVFNLNEAERAMDVSRESLRVLLNRAVEKDRIYRIKRGLYTVHDDPLVYGTRVEIPSYLSLWSGLRWYDVTTQVTSRLQVMVNSDTRDLENIKFYRTRAMFGFSKKVHEGFEVFVADPEKLLVDCLARPEVPADQLRELLQLVDSDTLVDYCLELDNRAVAKRAGFLYEEIRGEEIGRLKQMVDSNYARLDVSGQESGGKNHDWKVLVNNGAY